MKKLLLVFLMIPYFIGLNCNEANLNELEVNELELNKLHLCWNSPGIISETYTSILQKNESEEKIYNSIFQKNQSPFAFRSLADFSQSVKNFFAPNVTPEDKHSFLDYQTDTSRLIIKFISGYDYALVKDKDNYSFVYYGIKMRGHLHKNLLFYTNIWKGHYSNNTEYAKQNSVYFDSWSQDSDDDCSTYLDNISSKLQYNGKHGNYAVGRGKYEIGNNIGGSIILSDNCNDYGYFSAIIPLGKLKISFIHATLIADSTNIEGNFNDKYLVTHKFDWYPSRRLHLFGGEHVVYGNRAPDPSYLLPVSIFRVTEHNLEDRDNVLIYFGGNYKLSQYNTTYINFIFDELSKSKFFSDWWGNKYAVQAGTSFKFGKTRFGLEFTAIRPWLYTHKFMEDKFSNNNISLGFPEGSNLLNYALELNHHFRSNLRFDANLAFIRQGSVGNNFSINYDNRPSDHADWLEGEIFNRIKLKSALTWKPLAHHKIKLGFHLTEYKSGESIREIFAGYQAEY